MNKFSMRSLPAAMALSATLIFAAHAQVSVGTDLGVRTGVNTNIGNDVRANAGTSVSVSADTNTNTTANTNATVSSDGTVTRAIKRSGNAVKRTGSKVTGAVGTAADATKTGAYRAKNAVSDVAAKADRGIQKRLPASNAGATGQVNVQGSGDVSLQNSPPRQ